MISNKANPPFLETMPFLAEFFLLLAVAFLPFSKALVEIGILTGLSFWLLHKILIRERFPFPFPFGLFYSLLLISILLSFISLPPAALGIGFKGLLKWLKYLGAFFFCAEIFRDSGKTEKLLKVFFISMTLSALNGFYQIFTGFDLIRHYALNVPGRLPRMTSAFSSPNILASFLLLALPVSFYFWTTEKGKSVFKNLFYLAAGLLFFCAFILTFSRAAFVGFVPAVIFYAWINQKKRCLAVFFILLAGLFLAFPALRYNFIESLNFHDTTVQERLQAWQTTWKMIKQHPFLGNGVNSYHYLLPSFASPGQKIMYAHNGYLQIWSDIGLFGLLTFLGPIFWIFLRKKTRASGAQNSRLTGLLSAGLIAFLIQSFFDNNLYGLQPVILFWIFWGLLAAQSHPDKPQIIQKPSNRGFSEIPSNS